MLRKIFLLSFKNITAFPLCLPSSSRRLFVKIYDSHIFLHDSVSWYFWLRAPWFFFHFLFQVTTGSQQWSSSPSIHPWTVVGELHFVVPESLFLVTLESLYEFFCCYSCCDCSSRHLSIPQSVYFFRHALLHQLATGCWINGHGYKGFSCSPIAVSSWWKGSLRVPQRLGGP